MRLLFITILLIGLALSGQSQILDNGSLEGVPGTTSTPVNWFSCLASSTVDIGPGIWGLTQQAHDGNTYINMVCRGPEQQNGGTCEELSQTLNNTLEAGKCYRFQVYLSYAQNFGVTAFRNPLDLIINAGTDACSRDLEIGRYESIDHGDWRRYVTYINPSQDLNGMLLEVQWSTPEIYSGHMLVDDMRIEEISTPPIRQVIVCEGESTRLTAFEAGDALAIAWSNGSDEATIVVDAAGTYTVDVTLGNCVFTETFEVTLQESPQPLLTEDTDWCPGEEILLDASAWGDSFLWENGSTEPTFVADGIGTYNVQITNGVCTTSHSILIELGNCPPLLEMPNAFSPNGDGKNDRFTPIQTQFIQSMQTVLYNRWGDEVYSTNNLLIEWDGKLPNGEPAPPSTYYWKIVYTGLNGNSFNLKGTVSLIK